MDRLCHQHEGGEVMNRFMECPDCGSELTAKGACIQCDDSDEDIPVRDIGDIIREQEESEME